MSDGLCECGCGQRTTIAKKSWARWGHVRGQPKRFVKGHQFRGKTHDEAARVAISTGGEKRHGPRNGRWNGGRVVQRGGYVKVFVEGRGYVREHRLVMEQHLGRRLTRQEVVHHKLECEGGTGRVADNRIENLLLFGSHAEHRNHHFALQGSLEGEAHPSARIPDEVVRAIRSDPRSTKEIAEAYGVSRPYVSQLRLGRKRRSA